MMKFVKFQRKIIFITLAVSLTPLLLLASMLYYQFTRTYNERTEEQIRYRSRAQADALDLFLKERAAILAAMADTHNFNEMVEEKYLSNIFAVMNIRAGAFVDLGVINNAGQQTVYVGPYELRGLNYYQQEWFGEVMRKGVYISDVYMGYRQLPHFIIAVRRQEGGNSWILRATIDPEIFSDIIRSAQIGKTGDGFIINKEGVFQTNPRFHGRILEKSSLEPALFGARTTVVVDKNDHGKKVLYAGSWLKGDRWLLVISQEFAEETTSLIATREVEVGVVAVGVLAIVLATIFTTRSAVGRLRKAEAEMNQLNAQLVHSDKLAALGKMAASVAHEINNPLAVIMQKTGWMEDLLVEEDVSSVRYFDEYRTSLNTINEYVNRMKKVVHNMLGYARKMEPHLEKVDVNDTIQRTVDLLENYARTRNIDIHIDLTPDLPIIGSSRSELQQVFFNLISNAIDAIEKDGLIVITSRREPSNIVVNIADDGPGIPEDRQKKLFEPFFTTKEEGKGTGLGLWVSYNIMKNLGGSIAFTSKSGEGTNFAVLIPVAGPDTV